MKSRKISVNVFSSSLADDMLKAVEEYRKWVISKSKELLQRLTDEGYQIASAGFQTAQYDGTNDVSVSVENRGNAARAIVALGATVLFIEFGTGVTYPDDHPEKPDGVKGRGTYGHKLGRLPGGWRYPASHGAGSSAMPDEDHPGYLHTFGNPANKPMYEAAKQLREKLPEYVREVFGNDRY